MDWTLEVVQVPVTDVERAKAFYADQVGFAVDFDMAVDDKTRFAQLTPPGSGCSIQVSTGMFDMFWVGLVMASIGNVVRIAPKP